MVTSDHHCWCLLIGHNWFTTDSPLVFRQNYVSILYRWLLLYDLADLNYSVTDSIGIRLTLIILARQQTCAARKSWRSSNDSLSRRSRRTSHSGLSNWPRWSRLSSKPRSTKGAGSTCSSWRTGRTWNIPAVTALLHIHTLSINQFIKSKRTNRPLTSQ